jgi:hypothetical protein
MPLSPALSNDQEVRRRRNTDSHAARGLVGQSTHSPSSCPTILFDCDFGENHPAAEFIPEALGGFPSGFLFPEVPFTLFLIGWGFSFARDRAFARIGWAGFGFNRF